VKIQFKTILLIILLGLASFLHSQQLTHRVYGVEDGFINVEINNLIFSQSREMLTFSTGYLSIFDGYTVENIRLDTLPLNTAPSSEAILITDSGRLLVMNEHHQIFISDTSFRKFEKVESELEADWITTSFKKYYQTVFIFNTKNECAVFDEASLKFKKQDQFPFRKELELFDKNLIEFSVTDNIVFLGYKTEETRKQAVFIDSMHYPVEIDIDEENKIDFLTKLEDQVLIYDESENDFYIKNGFDSIPLELSMPDRDNNYFKEIYYDTESKKIILGLWKRAFSNKIYWVEFDSLLNSKYLGYIPNEKLSRSAYIEFFRENNLWYGSHHGLLRYDPRIIFFDSDDPLIPEDLHSFGEDESGNIWFGGYYSDLAYYDGLKMIKDSERKYGVLPGRYNNDAGELFFNNELPGGIIKLSTDSIVQKFYRLNGEETNFLGYYFKDLSNGHIAFGVHDSCLSIGNYIDEEFEIDKIVNQRQGLNLKNVLTIEEDDLGRIWMGRHSKGVAIYDPVADSAYTYLVDAKTPGTFGAISIARDARSNFWFGTSDGLYLFESPELFDPAKDDFFKATRKISLPNGDNSLVTFIQQIDNYIVFGNKTAVSFIPLDKWYQDEENTPIYQLYYGEDIQGGGSEQNMIFQDSKGYLWIGSQLGASRIDIRNFTFDDSKCKIEIKGIKNGKKYLELEKNKVVHLPTDNRNVIIRFSPDRNKFLLKNVFFDYALINEIGDTLVSEIYDQEGLLEMNYLAPGEYTLEITARKYGVFMDHIEIEIHAPYAFLENPGVRFLGIILTVGILLLFVYSRSRLQKRVIKRDLELVQLQQQNDNLHLQSIISSFNPHFINNSLHWVQSRYRKDHEMVKVIGRLSENIRYMLMSTRSGKAYHSLEDEMQLVVNYLAIQLIRFDNSFEFIGPSKKELEKYHSILLPIMQLQIHIENAIEHGLRNRIESSFVEIKILEEKDFIKLLIIDDGCGRIKAKELISRGTQTGTKMLKELHVMFNHNKNNEFKIKGWYEDLIYEDEKGQKYGTRKNILIPKKFTYEI